MATYIVVDKDKDPLEPGEIHAGDTILVNDGDVIIIDSTANSSTTFEAASGSSTNFEVQFNQSNSNDFSIAIKDDLNASIIFSDDVNIENIDIKAKDADSITLTAGDNVTVGKYEGSETGADTLVFGNDFTAVEDIKTHGGDDAITIGDDATIEKDIETGDGDDTVIIGDDLSADDIKTGEGDDALTIGNGAVVDDINTGKGNDTVTLGNDFTGDKIETKDGDDLVTIGDGAVVDDIKTEKGNDNVTLGNDFTGDKVETKDGDDFVTIGTGAVIEDLDGGKDEDTLNSATDFPDASGFENVVCFAKGTLILSKSGEVPVEALRAGDQVITLDHGAQPIRWIGSSVVSGHGKLAPVCIAKGALGAGRNLLVSPQHRLLVAGWRAELLFGEPEVLVAAKHLVDGKKIDIVPNYSVEYFHILFDCHEIVLSEGIPSESFHPGDVGMDTLSIRSRDEIFSIFPELRKDLTCYGKAARPSLRSYEGKLLVA